MGASQSLHDAHHLVHRAGQCNIRTQRLVLVKGDSQQCNLTSPMDKAKLTRDLERLVREAAQIAPSIARFKEQGNYGNVTDKDLDQQNFVRWEVEAGAILQELAASGVLAFKNLHDEYVKMKDASKRFHSRSILAHKVQELLASAIQLIASTVSEPSAKVAKHSDLNPWPVLRSFLLGLSSWSIRFALEGARAVPAAGSSLGYPYNQRIP